MNEARAFTLLAQAYLLLLQMPRGSIVRHRNEHVLATVRDAIASETTSSSQYVQEQFEKVARDITMVVTP